MRSGRTASVICFSAPASWCSSPMMASRPSARRGRSATAGSIPPTGLSRVSRRKVRRSFTAATITTWCSPRAAPPVRRPVTWSSRRDRNRSKAHGRTLPTIRSFEQSRMKSAGGRRDTARLSRIVPASGGWSTHAYENGFYTLGRQTLARADRVDGRWMVSRRRIRSARRSPSRQYNARRRRGKQGCPHGFAYLTISRNRGWACSGALRRRRSRSRSLSIREWRAGAQGEGHRPIRQLAAYGS